MSKLRFAVRLLLVVACAACSGSITGSAGSSCRLGECPFPALTLAAEIDPPQDSNLVEYEFPPQQIVLHDGVLALDFPPSVGTALDVRGEDGTGRVVASTVLLSRDSRVPGQPPVLSSAAITPDADPVVVRALAGASYDLLVAPVAPDDEHYLRKASPGLTLPDGTLYVTLSAPQETMNGSLASSPDADLDIMLQAFSEAGDDRTTVDRIKPGESFSLLADSVAGDWRLDATLTFRDSSTGAPETIPGLELDLEIPVSCDADASCHPTSGLLPSLDFPFPAVPWPAEYAVEVRGVDAGGVEAAVPNCRVVFEGDALPSLPPTGLRSATVVARADTGADGVARIPLVDGLQYRVTVLTPGGSDFVSTTVMRALPDDLVGGRLRVDLALGVRLSGTVYATHPTDEDHGVPGVIVSASPSPMAAADPDLPAGAVGTFLATTDDGGAFFLRVPPGTYDLELTPPDGTSYPRWSSDGVPVPADTTGLQIVLPDGVQIPVSVQVDGRPVSGATVRMLVLPQDGSRPPRERASAVTDETGAAIVLLPNP
jgi:hypothetical protein